MVWSALPSRLSRRLPTFVPWPRRHPQESHQRRHTLPRENLGSTQAISSSSGRRSASSVAACRGQAAPNLYVSKLAAPGAPTLYTATLGGSGGWVAGLGVDGAGNAFLAGVPPEDFPLVDPIDAVSRNRAFVAGLDSSGTVIYSTFQPVRAVSPVASGEFSAIGFAVDAAGNAYLAGTEPVTDPLRTTPGPSPRSRVVKIAPQSAGAVNEYFVYDSFYWADGTGSGIDVVVGRTGDLTVDGSVAYATANVTALSGEDYVSVQGTLSFAPGEAAKTVRIVLIPVPSNVVKGDFTFTFSLNPVTAVSGMETGTVTICNPKAPPPIVIPVVAPANVSWSATSNVPWLRPTSAAGSGSGSASFQLDPSALPPPGTYAVTIAWNAQAGGGPTGSGGATIITVVIEAYP